MAPLPAGEVAATTLPLLLPQPQRARKAKRRAGSNLFSLLLDIEQPLRDATHTIEALRLAGHGLFIRLLAGRTISYSSMLKQ
jgi:hypothetical protein